MKKLLFQLLITLVILTVYSCSIGQKPVYVSPVAEENGTGAPDAPIQLKKALAAANPGDLILLMEGEYLLDEPLRMDKSGMSEKPITVEAYQDGKVVLNGRHANGGDAIVPCLYIAGDNWHLKGIEFTQAKGGGVIITGSHNRLERCSAHHTGGTGFSVGLEHGNTTNIDGEQAAYNVFINCDSFMNFDWYSFYFNKRSPGTHADGFGCKLRSGKGNKFYGCRAWKNSDDNWDLFESGGGVEIVNCWNWSAARWSDFVEMFKDRTGEILTEELFSGDGNGFKMGGNHTSDAGDGCQNKSVGLNVLRNSVSFGNKEKGIDQNNHQDGTIIENCLSFNNGVNLRYWAEPNPGKQYVFRNNIIMGDGGDKPMIDIDYVSENNSWDLDLTFTVDDFVTLDESAAESERQKDGNLPLGFARLKVGSQAIDKGIPTPAIASAKDAIQLEPILYNGSAPDLGAYEYTE